MAGTWEDVTTSSRAWAGPSLVTKQDSGFHRTPCWSLREPRSGKLGSLGDYPSPRPPHTQGEAHRELVDEGEGILTRLFSSSILAPVSSTFPSAVRPPHPPWLPHSPLSEKPSSFIMSRPALLCLSPLYHPSSSKPSKSASSPPRHRLSTPKPAPVSPLS